MRRSMGFIFVLLLLTAVPVLAQPDYQVLWRYIPTGGAALDTSCTGTPAIPDGWIVKIFWDSSANGADAADRQLAICTAPPSCTTGPAYTCNYNQFGMNGVARGYGAGYFLTDSYWRVRNGVPMNPYFYLRIYSPTDSVNARWTSAVKTVATGVQTISFARADWTCTPLIPICVVKDAHE